MSQNHLLGDDGVLPVGGKGASAVVQHAVVVVADAEVRHGERVVLAEVVSGRYQHFHRYIDKKEAESW